MFEALYGRGEDHRPRLLFDLDDAYTGATCTMSVQRPAADAEERLVMRGQQHNVTIPRGIRAGQHIRLLGQGAPSEAAMGATVKVPTPNGVVELKVPEASVAGGKLRLKGRGMPGRMPSDFDAVLQIALPPAGGEAANTFCLYIAEQFTSFKPRAGLARNSGWTRVLIEKPFSHDLASARHLNELWRAFPHGVPLDGGWRMTHLSWPGDGIVFVPNSHLAIENLTLQAWMPSWSGRQGIRAGRAKKALCTLYHGGRALVMPAVLRSG